MADTKLSAETNEITTFNGDERLIICDDPDGTPEDGFVQIKNIIAADWAAVLDTWEYASATTITVPAGAAALYQKGDYLRLKQGGDYKYWVIYSVADALVTLIVNSDYTLADDTITDVAISRAANPFGFPKEFNYTPVVTGYSTAPTAALYRYYCIGRRMMLTLRESTNGTSNATGITISTPCAARTITNGLWSGPAIVTDNTATLAAPGVGFIVSAGTVVTLCPTYAAVATGWTNSGGKKINSFLVQFEF